MKYVTGIHGLNVRTGRNTCGDNRAEHLDWSRMIMLDTDKSELGMWGIELGTKVPGHKETFAVADHLRCIVDIMSEFRDCDGLIGFKDKYLKTDEYNKELFEKVCSLYGRPNWDDINSLMEGEYLFEWVNYSRERLAIQSCLGRVGKIKW